jgi:hypothetical protein
MARAGTDLAARSHDTALARIEAARSVTTVGQLADESFDCMINGRWKHPNIVRSRIEKDIKPHLGKLALDAVEPRPIDGRLRAEVKRGAPTIANDMPRWVRRIFDYAIKRHLVRFNPAAAFDLADAGGKELARERALSRDELVTLFDITQVNRAAAAVNPDKLLWLNQHYIKTSDPDHVARHLSPFMGRYGIDPALDGPPLREVVIALRERCKTLVEMAEKALPFYREFDAYEPAAAAKHLNADVIEPLLALHTHLEQLDDWQAPRLHALVEQIAAEHGLKFGQLAQPLRVALTGGAVSPAIDVTLQLIGRGRVLGRLERAVQWLRRRAGA